jgi:serine/threonine protein kinase
VIKEMAIRDEKSMEEWKREISCMVMYRSPFVVEIYGFHWNGVNKLSIIMEYMSRGDLYSILHKSPDKNPLSKVLRLRMARHIALGVSHLHKNRVVHRDIKSMNVLISDDYACKLTDFGTAKMIGANTQTELMTNNAGTPLWMAPEVKHGNFYSCPADIYSMGLVFYEIFEKALPLWDQYASRVRLPSVFQSASLVCPCIQSDPNRRPNADTVVDVLDKMIYNVCTGLKAVVPAGCYEAKGEFKTTEEKETEELRILYKYLVGCSAAEVDAWMERVFPPPVQKAAHKNMPGVPVGVPVGQPMHQMGHPMQQMGQPIFPPSFGFPPNMQAPPGY